MKRKSMPSEYFIIKENRLSLVLCYHRMHPRVIKFLPGIGVYIYREREENMEKTTDCL